MSREPLFKNVRLVSKSDKGYLSWSRGMAYERNVNRGERVRDTRQLLSDWLEITVQSELRNNYQLLDRNIIFWEERTPSGFLRKKYKEVDCLIGVDRQTIICVEVKSSWGKSSIKKARAQLNMAEALLKSIYPKVISLLVLADCSVIEPTLGKLDGEELFSLLGTYKDFREFNVNTLNYFHYYWLINSAEVECLLNKYQGLDLNDQSDS